MAHRKRQPRKFSSATFSEIVSDLPEKMEFVVDDSRKIEKVKKQICCECDSVLENPKVCGSCGLVQYYRKFRYVVLKDDRTRPDRKFF